MDFGLTEESIPQGLKPLFFLDRERAKPKGLAYPEARAKANANAGILHCVQDDVKYECRVLLVLARVGVSKEQTTATAKQNAGVSPLWRQSAPPSVEMTGFVEGIEKTKSNCNCNDNSRFLSV